MYDRICSFQSHIGAIRIARDCDSVAVARNNFNPTLVQLEYMKERIEQCNAEIFQSHIGAIRIHLAIQANMA